MPEFALPSAARRPVLPLEPRLIRGISQAYVVRPTRLPGSDPARSGQRQVSLIAVPSGGIKVVLFSRSRGFASRGPSQTMYKQFLPLVSAVRDLFLCRQGRDS